MVTWGNPEGCHFAPPPGRLVYHVSTHYTDGKPGPPSPAVDLDLSPGTSLRPPGFSSSSSSLLPLQWEYCGYKKTHSDLGELVAQRL